jgi:hypothetical protein
MRLINWLSLIILIALGALNGEDLLSFIRAPREYPLGTEGGFRYSSAPAYVLLGTAAVLIALVGAFAPMAIRRRSVKLGIRFGAAIILVLDIAWSMFSAHYVR